MRIRQNLFQVTGSIVGCIGLGYFASIGDLLVSGLAISCSLGTSCNIDDPAGNLKTQQPACDLQ